VPDVCLNLRLNYLYYFKLTAPNFTLKIRVHLVFVLKVRRLCSNNIGCNIGKTATAANMNASIITSTVVRTNPQTLIIIIIIIIINVIYSFLCNSPASEF